MATSGFITIRDHTGETSTTTFALPEITLANFAGVTQDLDEIRNGIQDLIIGKIINVGFTKTYDDGDFTPVTNQQAQRETKWLLTFRDAKQFLDALNTIPNPRWNKTFNIEVATADLLLLEQGEDFLRTNDSPFTSAAEAFNPNIRSASNQYAPSSPNEELVELVSVRHVGRNI
jgi:hypothetical protein